jgi:lysyl-tRNA synthetase class 2
MANMSHDPKSNHWRPSASNETLRSRARIIQTIRDFFIARDVLEVETPIMCHTSVTDPYIQSIPALFQAHPQEQEQRYYLQTSPEYAMKRMLAEGSGSIFQISKVFRQGEIGNQHNPEFTMLEWYREKFDHHDLMNEMDELLQLVLNKPPAERITYAGLFKTHLDIDAHQATLTELAACAKKNHINVEGSITDHDTWLNLLMTHYIEERIGQDRPIFIYDYPTSQAALARIQPGNPPVASRFEVYYKGTELANGFHELQNVNEQRKRFENNLIAREQLSLNKLPIDEYFRAALAHGLPDCAGVALGIDRLVMLATDKEHIADVLSFDFSRA